MKRALISGISGQDGAYLANHLLGLGYEVCGTSRDAQVVPLHNLQRLWIKDQVRLDRGESSRLCPSAQIEIERLRGCEA